MRRRSSIIRCVLVLIVGLVNDNGSSSLFSGVSSSSVVEGVTAIDGIFVGIECLRNISDLSGLCDNDIGAGNTMAGVGGGRNCT